MFDRCQNYGRFNTISAFIEADANFMRRSLHFKPSNPSQVKLDPNTGIFVTMNPAGKGYGGRQKLPDNLKQLFRPVAMTKPDNELIAEVGIQLS